MESLISTSAIELLQKELQELEDAYAECLADNVDLSTLRVLYLRIKALRREIDQRTKAA
jgi:hypothetical protein